SLPLRVFLSTLGRKPVHSRWRVGSSLVRCHIRCGGDCRPRSCGYCRKCSPGNLPARSLLIPPPSWTDSRSGPSASRGRSVHRRANEQINLPIALIPRTFCLDLAVFNGHAHLGQYSLCRITGARRGFACRHGIGLLVPVHDLNAAVAMRLNLQDRGFGLGQNVLFGTHHGIPVVKPDAKFGTIGCWPLVPVGDVDGVAMPVRSCARKAEGEQSRQRNQKKEVASRHGVLPAPIDDGGGDWSRAIQPKNHSQPSPSSSVPMGGPSGGSAGGVTLICFGSFSNCSICQDAKAICA